MTEIVVRSDELARGILATRTSGVAPQLICPDCVSGLRPVTR
jgi:hypothetical protein